MSYSLLILFLVLVHVSTVGERFYGSMDSTLERGPCQMLRKTSKSEGTPLSYFFVFFKHNLLPNILLLQHFNKL